MAHIVSSPRQPAFCVFVWDELVITCCNTSLHMFEGDLETFVLFLSHSSYHTHCYSAMCHDHHVGVGGLTHVEIRDESTHMYTTRQHMTLCVFVVWQWRSRHIFCVEQCESLLHWWSTHTNTHLLCWTLGQAVFHQDRHSADCP